MGFTFIHKEAGPDDPVFGRVMIVLERESLPPTPAPLEPAPLPSFAELAAEPLRPEQLALQQDEQEEQEEPLLQIEFEDLPEWIQRGGGQPMRPPKSS